MMIHEVTEKTGRYKARKRIGRGPGSGSGKTSGRGHKGAGSRAGARNKPGYEGGQVPFYTRFPKRGFSNVNFSTRYAIVNLGAIDARFDDGAEVNPDMLVKLGLLRSAKEPVKILGSGETTKKFNITAAKFTASAKEKIEKAGGTATEQ